MKIRLHISSRGNEQQRPLEMCPLVVGRAPSADICLAGDAALARLHARIWQDEQGAWIEDLGSANGTFVDEIQIRGTGPCRLAIGAVILLGDSRLTLAGESPAEPTTITPPSPEPRVKIVPDKQSDLVPTAALVPAAKSTDLEQRLAQLCEIPVLLAAETRFERRMQIVVEQAVKLVPGAQRGALLLHDPAGGRLILSAAVPPNQPSVSLQLARRALESREAFLWHADDPSAAPSPSILRHRIATGMYAPLRWESETLGVLCIDHPERAAHFAPGDLALLRVVAQYAAMAVGLHQSAETLRRQTEFTERLFAGRFPPQVRQGLLRQASSDNLVLGTRQSPLTVLIADIRGFTRLSEQLGAKRLSDLLNEYFPPLIDALFHHGGTIDRFAGDAIFTVFGSPEPDPRQEEHAVRAALEMQAAARIVSATRARRGAATCEIGIGIDCGLVLNGFIGNAERLEFAVIGDAANYASRYCAGAGGGTVMISPALHARVWNLVESEPVAIPTKHEGELQGHLVHRMAE